MASGGRKPRFSSLNTAMQFTKTTGSCPLGLILDASPEDRNTAGVREWGGKMCVLKRGQPGCSAWIRLNHHRVGAEGWRLILDCCNSE